MVRIVFLALAAMLAATAAAAEEVRLYTSVDQPVAAKVIKQFEKQSGIRVILVTDAEGTKTTGLVERLRAEKANPRADLWWNNEISHTVRLADEGLLEPYDSPVAADIPAMFRDSQNRWTAVGFRIRVLVVSNSVTVAVTGYQDLTKPQLKGKIAIAKPGFGTAGGHFAALYAVLGEAKYTQYLRDLKANGIKVLGGNSLVVDYVANGQLLAGFTDNDDVQGAIANGAKEIQMCIPDQDGIGTMVVPGTVSLVKGGRNPEDAKKLADFLLQRQTEQMLIDEKYIYASVRDAGTKVKTLNVSFAEIARGMPAAVRIATRELEQ